MNSTGPKGVRGMKGPPAKLYLAGPMRGIPEFNFPAFRTATAKLRKAGFKVWSPHENDEEHGVKASEYKTGSEQELATNTGFNLRQALGDDLAWICSQADGIVMLPGWRQSKGATAEYATATALGLDIWYLDANYELHGLPIEDKPASAWHAIRPGLHLPDGSAERKEYPIYSGLLQYFPDACVAVAHVSYLGNQQHNPGQPLHWSREKSSDHHDTALRHLMDRGAKDEKGTLHSANAAWRALAICQLEIEADRAINQPQTAER